MIIDNLKLNGDSENSQFLIKTFCSNLVLLVRSPETVTLRRTHLRNLSIVFPDLLSVKEIDLLTYINPKHHGWSRSYRKSIRDSVRLFYRWLTAMELVTYDPAAKLPQIHAPRIIKPSMSLNEVMNIFENLQLSEQAILSLAYSQMLRRSEIARTHPRDRFGSSLTVYGKGDRTRIVPLTDTTLELLTELEALQGFEAYYFPGRFGGHLHPSTIYKWIKQHIGVGWDLHTFRRSGATHVFKSNHDLRIVQELLGHSSLVVTQQYLSTTFEELENAVEIVDLQSQIIKSRAPAPDKNTPDELLATIYSMIQKQNQIA